MIEVELPHVEGERVIGANGTALLVLPKRHESLLVVAPLDDFDGKIVFGCKMVFKLSDEGFPTSY